MDSYRMTGPKTALMVADPPYGFIPPQGDALADLSTNTPSNSPSQYTSNTLSIHPLNTPSQYTLLLHSPTHSEDSH